MDVRHEVVVFAEVRKLFWTIAIGREHSVLLGAEIAPVIRDIEREERLQPSKNDVHGLTSGAISHKATPLQSRLAFNDEYLSSKYVVTR